MTSSSSNSFDFSPPTSVSQEGTGSTPIPASVECESADEQARGTRRSTQPKTQNPAKMWTMSRYGATRHFPKYVNGFKNSERILWMKGSLNTDSHASSSHEPSSEPQRRVVYSPRVQHITEEYSREYFLPKLVDSGLVFRGYRMIFNNEPNGMICPLHGSPNRLSNCVFSSDNRS